MKNSFYLLLMFFYCCCFQTACKFNEPTSKYTISGILYNNETEKKPLSGIKVYITDNYYNFIEYDNDLISTVTEVEHYTEVTDKKGTFELQIEKVSSYVSLLIEYTYNLKDTLGLEKGDTIWQETRLFYMHCLWEEVSQMQNLTIYIENEGMMEVLPSVIDNETDICIRLPEYVYDMHEIKLYKMPVKGEETDKSEQCVYTKTLDDGFRTGYEVISKLPFESVDSGYYIMEIQADILGVNHTNYFKKVIKVENKTNNL